MWDGIWTLVGAGLSVLKLRASGLAWRIQHGAWCVQASFPPLNPRPSTLGTKLMTRGMYSGVR